VAEDAGGLAPGKDDNAMWRKIDRKDGAISHASDYNNNDGDRGPSLRYYSTGTLYSSASLPPSRG